MQITRQLRELKSHALNCCHKCHFNILARHVNSSFETLILQTPWTTSCKDCCFCSQLSDLVQSPLNASDYTFVRRRWHSEREKEKVHQDRHYFTLNSPSSHRRVYLVPEHYARNTDTSVDLSILKRWVTKCLEDHILCTYRTGERTVTLRVIDCKTKNTCIIPADARYVCLSYVWGHETSEDNTTEKFPRTVEDAVHVTLQLGIRYLWVDRYCIDQANEAEKHHMINNMDIVYDGATATIIAAAGDGPHAGLPGVRDTTRTLQQPVFIGKTQYKAFNDPRLEIAESTWSTRGWTYQEMLLSRRCLVFTPSQVYCQCRQGNFFWENISYDNEWVASLGSNWPGVFFQDRALPRLASFFGDQTFVMQCLSEYYARQLSYDTDIIKAFIRVVNASLSKENHRVVSHFYGIPFKYYRWNASLEARCSFVASLAWYVSNGMARPLSARKHTIFPSWSWASVKSNSSINSQGALSFPPAQRSAINLYDSRIFTHHRSYGRLELADYNSNFGNYEQFLPWIDVESWATVCSMEPVVNPENSSITYRLSGLESDQDSGDQSVSLDYFPDIQATRSVTVVLLGSFPSARRETLSILVLDKAQEATYLRLGTYTKDLSDRRPPRQKYDTAERFFAKYTPRLAVDCGHECSKLLPNTAVEGRWRRCMLRVC